MILLTSTPTRRQFLKATATLTLLSLTVALQPKQPTIRAAQLTAADGYGIGTYNQGAYPAQQHNIYLPLITKGA